MSWGSDTAVCNGALALLGAERITSLADDDALQAEQCRAVYDTCRDAVMRAFPWNFAIARTDLGAPLSDSDSRAPIFDWAYGFVLPSTDDDWCLRVLDTDGGEPYRVEGRVLVTNASTIKIKYIRRITAVEQWDESYKNALAANLAMMLAMPITKSAQIMDAMAKLYASLLSEGYSVDTQEGTPEEIQSEAILLARWSQGGF